VQGNSAVKIQELTPLINKDLKEIKEADGTKRKQTPAERMRELANEYDPEQKLKRLGATQIRKESDILKIM